MRLNYSEDSSESSSFPTLVSRWVRECVLISCAGQAPSFPNQCPSVVWFVVSRMIECRSLALTRLTVCFRFSGSGALSGRGVVRIRLVIWHSFLFVILIPVAHQPTRIWSEGWVVLILEYSLYTDVFQIFII